MSSVLRIGRAHLLAPVPALRALDAALADRLVDDTDRFLDALSAHRRSPHYQVRLRDPDAVPFDALAATLTEAADELRLAGDPGGLGSWAIALAARLSALLASCDPTETRALLFLEENDGSPELVIIPYTPEDAASIFAADAERR